MKETDRLLPHRNFSFRSIERADSFKEIRLKDDDDEPPPPPEPVAPLEEPKDPITTPVQLGLIVILVLLIIFESYSRLTSTREVSALGSAVLPDKRRIFLYSPRYHRYIRAQDGQMMATEAIPWQYGSSLEVIRYNEDCFQLRAANGDWLQLTNGELKASGVSKLDGSYFAAISMPLLGGVGLKVCGHDRWLELVDKPDMPLTDSASTDSMEGSNASASASGGLAVRLTALQSGALRASGGGGHHKKHDKDKQPDATDSKHKHKDKDKSKDKNKDKNKPDAPFHTDMDDSFAPYIFTISAAPQIRGVNLGGWLIPEAWMEPDFFNGTVSLCKLNISHAEKHMEKHLSQWVKEEDFQQISSLGFNSIRLPVGYWNVISDPYKLYTPSLSVSQRVIDFAFAMADKYNLTVLLDLHGAPGSQNSMDHSGCIQPSTWATSENVRLSLEALEAMVRRYGSHPRLLGIELLNEPDPTVPVVVLKDYYTRAYGLIRAYSKSAWVVFNAVDWAPFVMPEPAFYNVILDLHMYEWQQPHTAESIGQHIAHAGQWAGMLQRASTRYPVVVGEWSMSTGTKQAGQAYVDKAEDSFAQTLGWYLWTWKVQRGAGFDEWDVQYQYSLPNGLRPLK